jgi:hypothetical protein
VVPLVFIAYLFFKAWLDYRVQVKSLSNASQRTETDRPARGADVMQVAPPSTDTEEDIAS